MNKDLPLDKLTRDIDNYVEKIEDSTIKDLILPLVNSILELESRVRILEGNFSE